MYCYAFYTYRITAVHDGIIIGMVIWMFSRGPSEFNGNDIVAIKNKVVPENEVENINANRMKTKMDTIQIPRQ